MPGAAYAWGMTKRRAGAAPEFIRRLASVSRQHGTAAVREKQVLLDALGDATVSTARDLRKLHALLCFCRAYADNASVYRCAVCQLDAMADRVARLGKRQRDVLVDSGLAGTPIHYVFSFALTAWLVDRCPGRVRIDWASYEAAHQLDDVVRLLIARAEEEAFDDEDITSEAWIRRAASGRRVTDLAWLMTQLRADRRLAARAADAYEAAEVPLQWLLDDSAAKMFSSPRRGRRPAYHPSGPRRIAGKTSVLIRKPLQSIRLAGPKLARELVDVTRTALAIRHREVHAVTYANPKEIYVAQVGPGTDVVVLGVLEEHRLGLEANYGFVILQNGVAVGYGGASPLFHQVNTGVNVFPEFRGGEAALLFVQVLRVLHALLGCTRFIASPYQFGRDNPEAIASGAFWFYYKLGFRPIETEGMSLAAKEAGKIAKRPGYRSDAPMLRKLAQSDLHLTLPGARIGDYFEEHWLVSCSAGAAEKLGQEGCRTHVGAVRRVSDRVASTLGVRSRARWPKAQRSGFERLAPVVALVGDLDEWPNDQKRELAALMRAKGTPRELKFATRMRQLDRLRIALARFAKSRRDRAC